MITISQSYPIVIENNSNFFNIVFTHPFSEPAQNIPILLYYIRFFPRTWAIFSFFLNGYKLLVSIFFSLFLVAILPSLGVEIVAKKKKKEKEKIEEKKEEICVFP